MNVFQYAGLTEMNWKRNLSDLNPYEPKYTFYSDFSIAEFCECYMGDRGAVKDTFKNCINGYKNNIEALSELYIVLNHKIWAFYQGVDSHYLGCKDDFSDKMARLYDSLWRECGEFIYKNFEKNEEAMSYFYAVTD